MIYPDEIIRSNRKTLSISIDAFSRLIVRAPRRCSEERIFAFIAEKEAWILRKKSEMAGAGIKLPPENLHGYSLPLLGEYYTIFLTNEARISLDTAQKRLYLPRKNSKERLIKWCKDNAKRILNAVSEQCAAKMGVTYKSITVTSARSRWGCCTSDNRIRYSYRLIFTPREILEYVAVHELSHIIQKNHSPAFWREVEKLVPDWKQKRKWLRINSALMELF
jgi:predicted metal-dependent hydrolase